MQETQPEPQPASEVKPAPEPASQTQSEPKPKAGKKSGKKLWIAAAAVIAVALCGALVWTNAGKPADDTNIAAFAATTPTTVPTVAPTTAATVAEEASSQPMLYGLNMTPEEFDREFELLLDAAKSWTKATAPQNIKDFPIFPESLFELFDTLESAQSEMEFTDSTLTWKSNLFELLPKDLAGAGTIERTLVYWDEQGKYHDAVFESVGNCTYSVQAPADAWALRASPNLFFRCHNYLDGWNENLQVSYDIPNKRIEQAPYVSLEMFGDDYLIEWGHNWGGKNNYIIDIFSVTFDTPTTSTATSIYFFVYDATSGKLTEVRK